MALILDSLRNPLGSYNQNKHRAYISFDAYYALN